MEQDLWFSQVLRELEGRLLRYASKMVSVETAHEVVQEAFLRLWRERSPALKGREAPWLFCTTRNLCFDVLKKEGKVKAKPIDESISSNEEPALQMLVRREDEKSVSQKVAQLLPAQQEVIRLKFQDGFSYQEISEITGHSVSHVGVLIHQAIRILRQELAPQMSRSSAHGGEQ